MKKTLFFLIALFTLGHAAMAQKLSSGSLLKQDASVSQKNERKTAPRQADATATPYWVNAKSYYTEDGIYNAEQGQYCAYRTDLTFDGNKVYLKGFVDTGYFQIGSVADIEGVYDATAKTITISTPGYSEERTIDDYAKYGDVSYYGQDCSVVLLAGDFSSQPDASGQHGLETTDQLVFDVSDDLTTLTPRTGFGLWVLTKKDCTPYGCINFYQKGLVSIERMTEEANLAFLPSDVHFEGANVTAGATLKQTVKIVNKGLTDTDYTGSVNGDGLQLAAYRSIEAGGVQNVYVQLIPKKAGEFAGTVSVYSPYNTTQATLNVTATVGDAPDFSQIVKEGDIAFNIGNDYPFVITDTITGSPVAVSTNGGSNSSSSLYANFAVPEGKVGVVSWKGIKQGGYSNGMNIQLNDSVVFNDSYSHGMDVSSFTDDISNMLVLKPGTYVLQFSNVTNMDWDGTGNVRLRAYVYDLALRLYEEQEHLAVLKSDVLDFGEHFFDRLSVRDTLTATLINVGTAPLRLTSIDGQGAFGGVMDDETASFGQELPVQIAYESGELGEHNGSVMINTNGGFYYVACKASNVAIPVDYHPIVTSGDFSFNTSANHPFSVENNTAFNSTAKHKVDGNTDFDSFLEASFEVPENQVGVLGWTAHNSSADFLYFMGDTALVTGTRITIDGEKKMEFAGEDVDASSSNYQPEDLVLGPGRHTVRFFYLKKDSTPKYDDRLDISNLSLNLTDGVESVTKDSGEILRTEYYTVNGQRIARPQRGITLVKTVYSDGTSQTVKVTK